MKIILMAVLWASGCCVIVPINGQATSKNAKASKAKSADSQPPKIDVVNVDTVNVTNLNVAEQTKPTGKPENDKQESKSYLSRLIAPENLPNLILCIVGVAGVAVAIRTLRAISTQANLMDKQRIAMEGQLVAMQGQLTEVQKQATEMEKQTSHLEGSVAATKMSSEAAKLSADVAARVSIPTLVIEKFEPGETGAASLEAMIQYPIVNIVIKNCGQTPALLKFWNIVFTCEDLPAEPDYWNHPGSGVLLERVVVEPTDSYTIPKLNNWNRTELSLEDVHAIINHKKKLWAYGFICYDDIFRSARRRVKFCELALNVREGWIQWVSDVCPPIYQGIDEFPWREVAGGEKGRESQ